MIVSAAIKQDGIVHVGRRHHNIIADMRLKGFVWNETEIQGFVTDKGEFLNRIDARKHFIDSGQVSVSGTLKHQLYSEDLY